MKWQEWILFFIVYSVVGWCIDTIVRSLQHGMIIANNWLGIPFSPIYGVGAFAVIIAHTYIKKWHIAMQFFFYAIVLSVYEYIAGEISYAYHGHKLWDYSHIPFNIGGHTDPFHAIAWGVLALIVVHWLHPRLLKIARSEIYQKILGRGNSTRRQ